MPTWIWYAIGAAVFIMIFLYLRSSQNTPTTVVPSTNDLQGYNGAVNILQQILQTQTTEASQLNNHPYINKVVSG